MKLKKHNKDGTFDDDFLDIVSDRLFRMSTMTKKEKCDGLFFNDDFDKYR